MFAYYDKTTGEFDIQGDGLDVAETSEKITVTSGVYTSFIYDKKKRILEAAEDVPGGRSWTYIMDEGSRICFSSSLHPLKEKTGETFALNEGMLPHFMYNGFLYGKHTLVRGVFKLEPGTRLLFHREQMQRQVWEASYEEIGEDKQEEYYQKFVEEAVRKAAEKQVREQGKLNMSLSAGYDSNCILYFARKFYPEVPISCYSVGGCKGIDETEHAKKIAETYQQVSLKKGSVTPETLEHMEEIVERLEGAVYERGIFLQYELAKLLKEQNCKSIICGECADQIFNKNYYEPLPEDTFLFDYEHHPRQMGAYVVKKKNELMLNSFGIEVQYPFLDEKIRNLAYSLRQKNGIKKAFHIRMCKEWLPEHVLFYLEKQGGSTSLEALFEAETDIEELMKKSRFYSEEYRITQKYPPEEAKRDYYLTLKYVDLFKKIFCD